ncbi:MAG: ferredoxin, partial [Anaerolineae bacterium]|nr:ferredoxin [Anaerolineae bacterium]
WDTWDRPAGPPRVVDVQPGDQTSHLWAAALDIGTTTVTLYLVDLVSGRVVAQAADYNGQIRRGEDVISRIIYASKNNGLAELQRLVLDTINGLIAQVCEFRKIEPQQIVKMVVAGNPTMQHLFLALPPASIRLAPYVPAANQYPTTRAGELGIDLNP